jgi:hypothetical protein
VPGGPRGYSGRCDKEKTCSFLQESNHDHLARSQHFNNRNVSSIHKFVSFSKYSYVRSKQALKNLGHQDGRGAKISTLTTKVFSKRKI